MTEDRGMDEKLREAWLASGPDRAPAEGCPSDEEIWRAARGSLGGKRAGRILDHAVACAACSASLALAAELGAEANVRAMRPRRKVGLFVLAGLAAASVVIATGLALWKSGAPAGPAAPPLAQRVEASLWKAAPGGDVELAQGERIRPGDKLFVSLDNDEPVNLYVIDKDESGEVSVLFPVDGAQWRNPIEPGRGRRIPGETSWDYDSWEVSSAAGEESFIVVASLEPVVELESAILLMNQAAPREVVRGGAPEEEPSASAVRGKEALEEVLAKLRTSPRLGSGILLEEIVLDNER